jgi:hypothetical protein
MKKIITHEERLCSLTKYFYPRPNAHLDPRWPKEITDIRSEKEQYEKLKKLSEKEIEARYQRIFGVR